MSPFLRKWHILLNLIKSVGNLIKHKKQVKNIKKISAWFLALFKKIEAQAKNGFLNEYFYKKRAKRKHMPA